MLAAIVALALVVAAPAIAQVQQGLSQEDNTGTFNATFSANQSGSNSSQCVTPLQFGNTASLQNNQGFLQYSGGQGSKHHRHFNGVGSGQIQQEGSTFTFNPTLTATCNQPVQQSAAASQY